jgi:hypothetical protein
MTVFEWIVLYKHGEQRREVLEGEYIYRCQKEYCQLTSMKQFGGGVKIVVRGKVADVIWSVAVAGDKRVRRLTKRPLMFRNRRPIAITMVATSASLKKMSLFEMLRLRESGFYRKMMFVTQDTILSINYEGGLHWRD